MSDLYIQVQDGQTVNHPVLQQNLMDVFGEIPAHYEEFTRIPMPNLNTLGVFQKLQETYETPTYRQVDGVWQDIWTVVDLTEEEKAAKIETVRQNPPFASWTLDESTLTWNPPVPRPVDGKFYQWNEENQTWTEIEIPAPPTQPE
jgi:hypothetical protein